MHGCDRMGGGLYNKIQEEVAARVAEERVAETIETKIARTRDGAETLRQLSTRRPTVDRTARGIETLFRIIDPNAEGRVTTETMKKILKRCGVNKKTYPVEPDVYGYVSLYELKSWLLDLRDHDERLRVPSSYSSRKTARYDLLRRRREDAREDAIETYRQENPPSFRCAYCRDPMESMHETHACSTNRTRQSLVVSRRTRESRDWFQVWTSREEKKCAERARRVSAVNTSLFLCSNQGKLLLEDMRAMHESQRLEIEAKREWHRTHERPIVENSRMYVRLSLYLTHTHTIHLPDTQTGTMKTHMCND